MVHRAPAGMAARLTLFEPTAGKSYDLAPVTRLLPMPLYNSGEDGEQSMQVLDKHKSIQGCTHGASEGHFSALRWLT
jgi:hypothetical protein